MWLLLWLLLLLAATSNGITWSFVLALMGVVVVVVGVPLIIHITVPATQRGVNTITSRHMFLNMCLCGAFCCHCGACTSPRSRQAKLCRRIIRGFTRVVVVVVHMPIAICIRSPATCRRLCVGSHSLQPISAIPIYSDRE